MLFATSTNVTIFVKYTSAGVGKTGLTVKVAVNGPSGNIITVASSTNATEVDSTNAPGLYSYTLSSANDATEGAYNFHFYTTDTTVDQKQFGVLIYCFAWVGYINGAGGNLKPASAFPANFADLAITASTGRVDAGKISGTTQTARDIGASVLLSPGTDTGQVDISSGVIKSNLSQILGSALTESGVGRIVAAVKNFFDVAAPTGTINSLPAAIPAANGGLPTVNASNQVQASVAVMQNNVITTASINDNAVTSAKLTDGLLTSAKFADGFLTASKIADGALTAAKFAVDYFTTIVTDIWSYLITETPFSVANSIGKTLLERLASILAKANLITSSTAVTVTSPIASNQTITVIRGDDYYNTDGRAIPFTLSNAPDITGSTVKLIADIEGVVTEYTGVVASATQCYVEFSSEQTLAMTGGLINYNLQCTLSNTHIITPVRGKILAEDDVR